MGGRWDNLTSGEREIMQSLSLLNGGIPTRSLPCLQQISEPLEPLRSLSTKGWAKPVGDRVEANVGGSPPRGSSPVRHRQAPLDGVEAACRRSKCLRP